MIILKKLFFAIPFLLAFIAFSFQLNPFLQNPNLLLSLDFSLLTQIATLLATLLFSVMFFIIFATLAYDWRLSLPAALLASLAPLLFINNPTIIILIAGFLLSFGLIYFLLENKLKNYLTFQPTKLLAPSVKQTTTLIILFSAFAFYLTANTQIQLNGFKVPDSLLEQFLQFIPNSQLPEAKTDTNLSQFTIPPEQLQLLKQNPGLLEQYGLSPEVLDQFDKSSSRQTKSSEISTQDLLKPMLEKQIQDFIKPYTQYIPIFLALTFFLTMHSIASFLSIFLSPLIWLVFLILEKTGFVKFEIETREVKKLVV